MSDRDESLDEADESAEWVAMDQPALDRAMRPIALTGAVATSSLGTLILAVTLLIGQLGPAVPSGDQRTLVFVALVLFVGLRFGLIAMTWVGRGWARLALTAVSVVGIAAVLLDWRLAVLDALVVVLLWLPQSSRWFRQMRQDARVAS